MSLFSKKKSTPASSKTNTTSQPERKYPERKPNFVALGGYDERCNENYKNIKTAMEQLKIKDELIRVVDLKEIAKYGTMQTPGFAIEGRLMSDGRAISIETAKSFIMKSGFMHYR